VLFWGVKLCKWCYLHWTFIVTVLVLSVPYRFYCYRTDSNGIVLVLSVPYWFHRYCSIGTVPVFIGIVPVLVPVSRLYCSYWVSVAFLDAFAF
jgi:hypothetical protein